MGHDDRLKTLEAAVHRLAGAMTDLSDRFRREECAAVRRMLLDSEGLRPRAPDPEETPFQEHMSKWLSGCPVPSAMEEARLTWNAACSHMRWYLVNKAAAGILGARFYTLVDQAIGHVAEPKPPGDPPEDHE